MGIRYDATNRKWIVTPAKLDYKTDYPTNADTTRPTNLTTTLKTDYALPAFLPTNLKFDYPTVNSDGTINQTNEALNTKNYNTNIENAEKNIAIEKERQRLSSLNLQNSQTNSTNALLNVENKKLNDQAVELNKNNDALNKQHLALIAENTAKNNLYDKVVQTASSTKGGDYVDRRDQLTTTDLINAGVNPKDAEEIISNIKLEFKRFYQTEKLVRWDDALGAQPPYGTFDPNYYKQQNATVNAAWNQAVANDDIDITERYGENNYYWQHYTNIGKSQGLRGSKEEDLVAADKYIEKELTDKEIQDIRDLQLGVDTETITQRLLNVPEVSNEWAKARQGDKYWNQLGKERYLDVYNPEEFAVLFRLSERPEDKQVILNYNINAGSGITQLEDAINTAINTKKTVEVKKFGALSQTILKDAINEMKKQRGREQMLQLFRGFEGFTEVTDINRELSNSILGDTGVGGLMSITSGKKGEENLLNALQNVTGMRNNVVYNWQQWFDTQIKEKYGVDYSLFEPLEEKKDILNAFLDLNTNVYDSNTKEFSKEFLSEAGFSSTQSLVDFLNKQGEDGSKILTTIQQGPSESANTILRPLLSRIEADIKTLDEGKQRGVSVAYSTSDKTEMMNITAQYARNYIDEFLIPRFNSSKSMDEFIELLDIKPEERNPFELYDIEATLKKLGQLNSQVYLDQLKNEEARTFDPDFYFNPTGDASRLNEYAEQKQTIEEDWEKAKNGDPYWSSQVYRFGIDVNNKAAFARMHFEVKGQGKGYDAADDITNASKVRDFIFTNVMPTLEKEAGRLEMVFGTFITPEQFADEMLRGLDPVKTPEAWNEVLNKFKVNSFGGTVDDLRNYIIETLRGNSAQDIREQIKFLNEKRERPTQEILGITYIQKEEDYVKGQPKATTQLYAVFRDAGYKGTEDDFYQNMFPDLDRTEQVLLTKGGSGGSLSLAGFDFKNPWSSLASLENFFPGEEEKSDKEGTDAAFSSSLGQSFYTRYLKLKEENNKAFNFYGDDEDKAFNPADSFLNDFKSLLKL